MLLENKKVIQLVDQKFEDLELWYPVLRLREEGAIVDIVGDESQTNYYGKNGVPVSSDFAFSEVNPENYDAILIPGGWAPDKLRRHEEVLTIVQYMDETKKPIGAICHAGWVLVSADVIKGRKMTSTPAIKDDVENAGANWVDEPVVVDDYLVSSRRPEDLPEYMKAFISVLKSAVVAQT